MRIPFGTMSYRHTSLPLSAQRMVNCYLEPAPPHAKTFAAVIGSYGVANYGVIGTGAHRGSRVIRGKLYAVYGTTLYRVNEGGSGTALGTVPGSARCFIAGDETNILIVDPVTTDGYYYDGSTVQQVTDPDWPGAIWCDYLDGYFLIIKPGSGQFYITDNRNPSSIEALEFASAERYPDDLVTGVVDHGELILLGTESGEGFYNSGNSDFPISKISSADIEIGCKAPHSVKKTDNGICFVGSDGKVYRLNGYSPTAISTPAVEQAIAECSDKSFIGSAWCEPGHAFYGLKSTGFAWVYDFSTQLWHERESYGLDSWRWASVDRCYDRWIVGDTESNAIGYVDANTFTEFGQILRVECASPPVGEENLNLRHGLVELVFDQGVGLISGQGSDPQVMLQFSDDGGRTWSSEKWRGIGRQGEYKNRARWKRLGQARDRIYRYAISDPVRRNLILATTNAHP